MASNVGKKYDVFISVFISSIIIYSCSTGEYIKNQINSKSKIEYDSSFVIKKNKDDCILKIKDTILTNGSVIKYITKGDTVTLKLSIKNIDTTLVFLYGGLIPEYYSLHNNNLIFISGKGFHYRKATLISNKKTHFDISIFESQLNEGVVDLFAYVINNRLYVENYKTKKSIKSIKLPPSIDIQDIYIHAHHIELLLYDGNRLLFKL